MSGLGDAHTHLSWNNGDLGKLGELGVEEHTLLTAQSAKVYLDSGYTMCYGAASAKERLDVAIRDAINSGSIPGPRYLANGKEMAVPDGELIPGITAFAKGPLEMREVLSASTISSFPCLASRSPKPEMPKTVTTLTKRLLLAWTKLIAMAFVCAPMPEPVIA
jgi:imidazolonepropionase-like amidohydrolase